MKNKRGFTLVELLVVMAIIALLLTIAAPRYFGYLDRSKETALKANLQVIRTSIDNYYSDKGTYPEALERLVEGKYLRAVPVDPITESNKTWVLIQPQQPGIGGVYDVKSGAPGLSKDGTPYAEF